MRLKDKTAFITGASRGIGAAVARRFAEEGAKVCLAARSAEPCQELAFTLSRQGLEARAVECDVTLRDSLTAAVTLAAARWGRIDILVNNAGTSGPTPLDGTPEQDAVWDKILATNLTAVFRVTRTVLPRMPAGGRVINLSSVLGRFGVAGLSAYVATKHAVVGLTRAMALELAPRHITVNAICPGWVETEMARAGFANLAAHAKVPTEEGREIAARMAPLGEILQPSEVAALAVYIASDEARNLTGQAIVLDGGQVMP